MDDIKAIKNYNISQHSHSCGSLPQRPQRFASMNDAISSDGCVGVKSSSKRRCDPLQWGVSHRYVCRGAEWEPERYVPTYS